MRIGPYTFDEFFAVGMEESVSPFLTPESKKWGKSLPLKGALLAAFFYICALVTFKLNLNLAYLFLSFTYFLVAPLAIQNTLQDLKNLELNINVLTAISAFLALLLKSPFEGALLLVLFEISSTLERSVAKKAKGAIHELHKIEPKKANVIHDDKIISQALSEVEIGDKILIQAGEIIPLDGKILTGSSFLNLSHLTGESRPLAVKEGDSVSAGTINLEGSLTILVTANRLNSALERIVNLITQAQEGKPKLQRVIDRFGQNYATLIITLTFSFALLLPLFFNMSYFGKEGSIYRALAFMIAASPCALVLATPTAYLSAISACAKRGIIIKGGIILDALDSCKNIAFDKTGTLTKGELTLKSIENLKGALTFNEALLLAEALERNSTHPIALAVCQKAKEMSGHFEIQDFKTLPGFGVEGRSKEGKKIFFGNLQYLQKELQNSAALVTNAKIIPGEIIAFLVVNDNLSLFRFQDSLREESKEVIEELKGLNLHPLMFSGDNKLNCEVVAKSVHISDFFYELHPDDKLKLVADFAKKGGIAMVGDGINDAPALARASVGISMGKIGSSTATNASDIILLSDDLKAIKWLFKKAKKTMKIVKENLFFALSVIILASLPALFGLLPLWIAVILHEGGTLIVGLNSLRLLKSK
jgi:Zn2+/Cd2+-exporting ATPase